MSLTPTPCCVRKFQHPNGHHQMLGETAELLKPHLLMAVPAPSGLLPHNRCRFPMCQQPPGRNRKLPPGGWPHRRYAPPNQAAERPHPLSSAAWSQAQPDRYIRGRHTAGSPHAAGTPPSVGKGSSKSVQTVAWPPHHRLNTCGWNTCIRR